MTWVRAFAPATVSNVGPGFDAFGFALVAPGDHVAVRLGDAAGVHIVDIEGDGGRLPREAGANTAAVAAAAIWRDAPRELQERGLQMRIEKGLHAGTGLGSSAASAVAGAVAAARLCTLSGGAAPDETALLAAAIDGEAATSGTRHADNVAPALLGGFTIVQGIDPPVVARFVPALAVFVAAVTPAIEIETSGARAALPETVPLAAAVQNWSNAAALVLGLVQGDRDLVARSLCDAIVEPVRARVIPGCDAVRQAALAAGAFSCAVSGSGPTLFALADDAATAAAVGNAMREAFAAAGHASTTTVSPLGAPGARIA